MGERYFPKIEPDELVIIIPPKGFHSEQLLAAMDNHFKGKQEAGILALSDAFKVIICKKYQVRVENAPDEIEFVKPESSDTCFKRVDEK